jgi:hypothetical protein
LPEILRNTSARKHYLWALETWSVIQCPKILRMKKVCGGGSRVDYSDRERDAAIDILKLAGARDSTGYMRAYFEAEFPRAFWYEIPEPYRGHVARDIRCFKEALKEGGYEVKGKKLK